jgi:hypothetical protein
LANREKMQIARFTIDPSRALASERSLVALPAIRPPVRRFSSFDRASPQACSPGQDHRNGGPIQFACPRVAFTLILALLRPSRFIPSPEGDVLLLECTLDFRVGCRVFPLSVRSARRRCSCDSVDTRSPGWMPRISLVAFAPPEGDAPAIRSTLDLRVGCRVFPLSRSLHPKAMLLRFGRHSISGLDAACVPRRARSTRR